MVTKIKRAKSSKPMSRNSFVFVARFCSGFGRVRLARMFLLLPLQLFRQADIYSIEYERHNSLLAGVDHCLEDRKGIKMRMRNKYRKPTTLRCNAGSRCSTSTLVWSLVGVLLMLHLYTLISHTDVQSKEIHRDMSHRILLRELEEVEEENIQMPPPRKRSPRAAKRKPKRPTTLIDEFLDESSQIRHVFFPTIKTAVDPMKDAGNDSFYYYPGRIWLDTEEILFKPTGVVFCMMRDPGHITGMESIKMVPLTTLTKKEQHG
ncbi:UNVERIFIED_CONTAM: hypothetical protein Sradi_4198300 [Sesamum radiatum]|uniref:Uncharacterized protein n=1 Tax=Sesamum radiatum TaxID=300843 RepID=A0AAW2P4Q6_SESRA